MKRSKPFTINIQQGPCTETLSVDNGKINYDDILPINELLDNDPCQKTVQAIIDNNDGVIYKNDYIIICANDTLSDIKIFILLKELEVLKDFGRVQSFGTPVSAAILRSEIYYTDKDIDTITDEDLTQSQKINLLSGQKDNAIM